MSFVVLLPFEQNQLGIHASYFLALKFLCCFFPEVIRPDSKILASDAGYQALSMWWIVEERISWIKGVLWWRKHTTLNHILGCSSYHGLHKVGHRWRCGDTIIHTEHSLRSFTNGHGVIRWVYQPPLSIVVGLDEDACRSDEELEEVLLEPPCIRCSWLIGRFFSSRIQLYMQLHCN